jgi:hypothetical protein
MNNNHVSPAEQSVQVGDMGGDEYNSMVCTGYHVSERPGLGFPSVVSGVWWIHHMQKWYMCHPTNRKKSIEVPASLTIHPTYEDPAAVKAREVFEFSIIPGTPGYSKSDNTIA